MKLTVVGCAPAWTRRPGRASSCYLIEHEGRALVLDMGQGAFAELARYRSPDTIDAILISHLHADHLVDLIPLRHFLTYEATDHPPTRLLGPTDLRARVDAFQAHVGFLDCLIGEPLEPGTLSLGPFLVEARHVTHIPDSFAFRLGLADTAGPGLVYSGDCGVADDLLPLTRPGDVLLCEAAFGVGPKEASIHLTAAEAAGVARRAGAARLILTHILDRSDQEAAVRAAADVYRGAVELAIPGLVVSLG